MRLHRSFRLFVIFALSFLIFVLAPSIHFESITSLQFDSNTQQVFAKSGSSGSSKSGGSSSSGGSPRPSRGSGNGTTTRNRATSPKNGNSQSGGTGGRNQPAPTATSQPTNQNKTPSNSPATSNNQSGNTSGRIIQPLKKADPNTTTRLNRVTDLKPVQKTAVIKGKNIRVNSFRTSSARNFRGYELTPGYDYYSPRPILFGYNPFYSAPVYYNQNGGIITAVPGSINWIGSIISIVLLIVFVLIVCTLIA
jgi:hypothetical protein